MEMKNVLDALTAIAEGEGNSSSEAKRAIAATAGYTATPGYKGRSFKEIVKEAEEAYSRLSTKF